MYRTEPEAEMKRGMETRTRVFRFAPAGPGPRPDPAGAKRRQEELPRSAAGAHRLEVGALPLVRLGEGQHVRVGRAAPRAARLQVDPRPPALVLRQAL